MGNARLSLAIAWLAAAGLVQSQVPPGPYASISGVVLSDATGTPIRRAIVTLSTLDTPPLEAVTFTESSGIFGFTAIPPGKYRLLADMDGFQHAWFGASTPATRPPGTPESGSPAMGAMADHLPVAPVGDPSPVWCSILTAIPFLMCRFVFCARALRAASHLPQQRQRGSHGRARPLPQCNGCAPRPVC